MLRTLGERVPKVSEKVPTYIMSDLLEHSRMGVSIHWRLTLLCNYWQNSLGSKGKYFVIFVYRKSPWNSKEVPLKGKFPLIYKGERINKRIFLQTRNLLQISKEIYLLKDLPLNYKMISNIQKLQSFFLQTEKDFTNRNTIGISFSHEVFLNLDFWF